MANLPAVNGKAAVAAFQRLGFHTARITSSHHVLKRDGHPLLLTVPVHGAKSLKKGTLNGLIKDSGHTREEFIAALR